MEVKAKGRGREEGQDQKGRMKSEKTRGPEQKMLLIGLSGEGRAELLTLQLSGTKSQN